MKIFRLLICIFIVTLAALIYVHQQIEIVKLSYVIDSKEKKLKDILDYKDTVSYTIENLESPSRLEKILLAKNIDIAFPKAAQIVKAKETGIRVSRTGNVGMAGAERRFILFSILDFINPRAEANATEK